MSPKHYLMIALAGLVWGVTAQGPSVHGEEGRPTRPFFIPTHVQNQEILSAGFKDRDGDLSTSHREIGVSLVIPLPEQSRLILSGSHEYNIYRFDEASGAAGVLRQSDRNAIRSFYTRTINEDWSGFVALGMRWSAERGASRSDGRMQDGQVGVTYRVHDRLQLGLVALAMSRLGERNLYVGGPSVQWEITERLSLRTGRDITLRYQLDQAAAWHAALQAGYYSRNIRLNDEGPAPDGVSRERYVNTALSLEYRPNPGFFAKAEAGLVHWRTLRLYDEGGQDVYRARPKPAPSFAVSTGITF